MRRPYPDEIAGFYAAAFEADALHRIATILLHAFGAASTGLWTFNNDRLIGRACAGDVQALHIDHHTYFRRIDSADTTSPPAAAWAAINAYESSAPGLAETGCGGHEERDAASGFALALEDGCFAFVVLRLPDGRTLRPDDKLALEEFGIYLRGALVAHRRFIAERRSGPSYQSALDALSFGVVICTGDASILYANPAASALVRTCNGVVLGGRAPILSAPTGSDAIALKAMIRAAANGVSGAIRLAGHKGPDFSVIAIRLPVEDGPEPGVDRVFLCLSRSDTVASVHPVTLQRLFGLSPAQAALCVLLSDGKTFEETAVARGVAITTARTHFQTILFKTQTRNLRGLLRLLASMPPVVFSP